MCSKIRKKYVRKLKLLTHTKLAPFSVPLVHSKVSKDANIGNRYNQVPHLTQDTNGKVTNSQLETTNESQEVSPFPAGDHKAHINRRSQIHSKYKTEKKTQKIHKRRTALERSVKYFTGGLKPAPTSPLIQMWIKAQNYMYLVCMKDP